MGMNHKLEVADTHTALRPRFEPDGGDDKEDQPLQPLQHQYMCAPDDLVLEADAHRMVNLYDDLTDKNLQHSKQDTLFSGAPPLLALRKLLAGVVRDLSRRKLLSYGHGRKVFVLVRQSQEEYVHPFG